MTNKEKIESMRAEILLEADVKGEAEIRSAREWAEALIRTEKDRIDRETEKELAAAGKAAEDKARQLVLSAQLEQRNIKLREEAELVEGLFDDARKRLGEIRSDPNYPEMVKAMITEAVKRLTDDDLCVFIDPRDEGLIDRDFLSSLEIVFTFSYNRAVRLELAEERIATGGGVVVGATGKNLYINNTFEERLASLKNEIKTQIMKEFAQ